MYWKYCNRQRGAALVIALLIVAIVVLLAVTAGNNFLLLFKRVENALHADQARAYLLGAEGIARSGLLTMLEVQDYDTLFDAWHQPQQFATDHGVIRGRINDLQGRFNLNNLSILPVAAGQAYSVHQQRFIRLLQLLDVEPKIDLATAETMTQAIVAWQQSADTAFDSSDVWYYYDTSPAMRMAHGPMLDVSELRVIKGIEEPIYQALRPYVTVWPTDDVSAININTASELILRTLGDSNDLTPLSAADAQTLLSARERQQGFASLDAFFEALSDVALDSTALGVTSDYFLLHSEAELLDRSFVLNSVLHRDRENATVTVVARSPMGLQ